MKPTDDGFLKEDPVYALIIDDDVEIRRLLNLILGRMGYQVREAINGREGLEILRKGPLPTLVLVDWKMPEMDGVTFLRAVRSDRELMKLRIMMVTGLNELNEIESALDAGADEYLMKPFTQRTLREKLAILGL